MEAANSAEIRTGRPSGSAQRFNARDLVDGGSDDREVEPVGRADIAVEHFPDVKRDVDHHGRQARRGARLIKSRERLHRFHRGVERTPACLPAIRFGKR